MGEGFERKMEKLEDCKGFEIRISFRIIKVNKSKWPKGFQNLKFDL